jgi:thiosulfate dehydrogenase
MGRVFLGIILGVILAPVLVLAWFRFGQPPVAAADPPLPYEQWITSIPLHARISHELVSEAPIQVNEENLLAGAQIYRDQCAACHGFYGKPASFAAHMFPRAPQLLEKHRNGNAVGVSDDPPGETVWKVDNGIRLTGMPAFKQILSNVQIWQVSLLLANADKPLPPAAWQILRNQPPAQEPAAPVKKPMKQ